MLSGPKRNDDTSAANSSEGPFKTFTIDLNRPPGSAPTPTVEESAPPPETGPVPLERPAEPEGARAAGEAQPTDREPLSDPLERVQPSPEPQARESARASAPPPVSPPTVRPQPSSPSREPSTPVSSQTAVPTSRGWAVQLGSFSNRATAERMVSEVSSAGQSAFVMPVKSGANTLYRVRVGPFSNRAAADAALATIKKRVANAAVVAHP